MQLFASTKLEKSPQTTSTKASWLSCGGTVAQLL